MSEKQQIIDFMTGFTAETTPGAAKKIADYRDHLRPGTTVYITFLPGSDFADTIDVAKRLRAEGFNPVPHFAARSITSKQVLENNIRRVTEEAGVNEVLAIAGAVNSPLGEFEDSTKMLNTGLFDKYGIKTIGVAGHPEGSPDMPDAAIAAALKWKNGFAERTGANMYVITQFAFEAEPIIAWDKALQAEGNKLTIRIGVPGLATLKSLLGHAKACGVGASMRVLTKQARNISRLLIVNAPDKQVRSLAKYQATDPKCGIQGVHMYPLGGLKKSSLWTYGVMDGDFTVNEKGDGFKVHVDLG